MARQTRSQSAKDKKDDESKKAHENDDDDSGEDEHPRYYVDSEDEDGNTVTRKLNLRIILKNLQREQQQMDDVASQLADLVNEHIELLRAGDEEDLADWRAGAGQVATRAARETARLRWSAAQGDLEDFYHFQNVTNRWHRRGTLRTLAAIDKELQENLERNSRSAPNKDMIDELCARAAPLLDRYDELRFGSADHRYGRIDASGRPGADKHDASNVPRLVGPRELHLWTPPYRQPRSGLGRRGLTPHPYNIHLDFDAIEARRKEVEETLDQHGYGSDRKPSYKSHNERRISEKDDREAAYKKAHPDAPNTKDSHRLGPAWSTTKTRETKEGKVTEDSFRKIQTEQGLFISALESTYDWRTSYDCLGRVKNGINGDPDFETSAERDTIDGPPKLGEEYENEDARTRLAKRKIEEEKTEGKKKGNKKKPKKLSAKERTLRAVTASIEYPYPAHEFTGTSKKREVLHESDPETPPPPPTTTTWAEATYGRREWHVNMMYSPSSSVHSPPRSPINFNDVEIDTIPPDFPNEKLDQIEQSKRRCPHDQDGEPMEVDGAASSDRERRRCPRQPELCRAWWTHAPDECWIFESTQVKLLKPVELTEQPLMDLEPPKDFRLPNSGRKIYDDRIIDHYGIMGSEGTRWPFLGVRVPYEPMTFDDMKLSKSSAEETAAHVARDKYISRPEGDPAEAKERILASDAKHRVAHEVHSLAVPIIREPVEPWGSLPAKDGDDSEPDENDPPESDGSDSEGDEFYNGYHNRTSRPAGSGDDDEASSVEGDLFLDAYENAVASIAGSEDAGEDAEEDAGEDGGEDDGEE